MQKIEALEIWLRGTVHGRLAIEERDRLRRFRTLCVRLRDTPTGTPTYRALMAQVRAALREHSAWESSLDEGRGLSDIDMRLHVGERGAPVRRAADGRH